jgi:predicted phage terminase large subunit-like protein
LLPSRRTKTRRESAVQLRKKIRQTVCAQMRRRLEPDLKSFVFAFWPILEPTTPLEWNWHLDLLCDHLTQVAHGKCKRLIVNVPPRSMKSLLCTVFYPVWRWCSEPQRRFMSVSYSDELSTEHSIFRRNVLASELYRILWGHRVKFARGQNLKTQYQNTRRGAMFATSITGSATGKGCDELIVDDPLNAKKAFSDQEREATNRNFDTTFRSRLNHPATGTILVIMQRLHDNDLCGHLLEREPGVWTHIRLGAEAEQDEQWKFPISGRVRSRAAGDLLWPSRWSREVLAGLKTAMGSWAYSGQYQQNPAPIEGSVIRRKWIRFYRELPSVAYGNCPLDERGMWLQSWDCTFKETRDSDYVVGQVWWMGRGGYYLVDQVRERLDFVGTREAIRQMTRKYPQATTKLVEDKANGPAVIASLSAEIDGIIPVVPEDSKLGRLHAVTPLFEAGNVFLPESTGEGGAPANWVDDFVEEITRFPAAPHDDQVDACTQALLFYRSQFGGIFLYYMRGAEQLRQARGESTRHGRIWL